jgi:hypothetical protein
MTGIPDVPLCVHTLPVLLHQVVSRTGEIRWSHLEKTLIDWHIALCTSIRYDATQRGSTIFGLNFFAKIHHHYCTTQYVPSSSRRLVSRLICSLFCLPRVMCKDNRHRCCIIVQSACCLPHIPRDTIRITLSFVSRRCWHSVGLVKWWVGFNVPSRVTVHSLS